MKTTSTTTISTTTTNKDRMYVVDIIQETYI